MGFRKKQHGSGSDHGSGEHSEGLACRHFGKRGRAHIDGGENLWYTDKIMKNVTPGR